MEIIVRQTVSKIGYFHLYDAEKEALSLTVWSNEVLTQCRTTHVSHYPLGSAGIWADCVREDRTVTHNDYPSQEGKKGLPEGHFAVERHMSSPVREAGRVVAILGIGNREEPYAPNDVNTLEGLIEEGWPVVRDRLGALESRLRDRRRFFESADPLELLSELIHAVGGAVELRDEYTAFHQSNVTTISDQIARQLGLPEAQRLGLTLGAAIHDLGKIAVPAEILGKTGRLFPAEYDILKQHARLGANLFRHLRLPWPIADMIEQHHERMDGSGYPDGLVGEMICLEARIIAVADTFDAMTSDRPYRRAPGWDAAVETLSSGRGVSYDAYVVDAFLACIDENSNGVIRKLYFK